MPMPRRRPLVLATAAAALVHVAGAAQAHHAMGGATPETLWQGIASGVGHPVIGFDHLAFVVAAGVLAAGIARGAGALAILAFVGAGAIGTMLHLAGLSLGPVELVVALTALGAGAALIAARPSSVPAPALVAGRRDRAGVQRGAADPAVAGVGAAAPHRGALRRRGGGGAGAGDRRALAAEVARAGRRLGKGGRGGAEQRRQPQRGEQGGEADGGGHADLRFLAV